ncbi:10370_t:CDS:2 [Funneliformis geosporum]|nr:10370_t:CDS:2 [Funneliformis geosporum]
MKLRKNNGHPAYGLFKENDPNAATLRARYYKDGSEILLFSDRGKGYNDKVIEDETQPHPTLTTNPQSVFYDIKNNPLIKRNDPNRNSIEYLSNETAPTLTSAMGMGGGHVPLVFQWRRSYIRENKENISPCLVNGKEHVAFVKSHNKNPRKLTPRECARLQGFSDDFKIVVSDTQAYKQFGNAVAVPVIREITRKIYENQQWKSGFARYDPMVEGVFFSETEARKLGMEHEVSGLRLCGSYVYPYVHVANQGKTKTGETGKKKDNTSREPILLHHDGLVNNDLQEPDMSMMSLEIAKTLGKMAVVLATSGAAAGAAGANLSMAEGFGKSLVSATKDYNTEMENRVYENSGKTYGPKPIDAIRLAIAEKVSGDIIGEAKDQKDEAQKKFDKEIEVRSSRSYENRWRMKMNSRILNRYFNFEGEEEIQMKPGFGMERGKFREIMIDFSKDLYEGYTQKFDFVIADRKGFSEIKEYTTRETHVETNKKKVSGSAPWKDERGNEIIGGGGEPSHEYLERNLRDTSLRKKGKHYPAEDCQISGKIGDKECSHEETRDNKTGSLAFGVGSRCNILIGRFLRGIPDEEIIHTKPDEAEWIMERDEETNMSRQTNPLNIKHTVTMEGISGLEGWGDMPPDTFGGSNDGAGAGIGNQEFFRNVISTGGVTLPETNPLSIQTQMSQREIKPDFA